METVKVEIRKPQIGDTMPAKKQAEEADMSMFAKDSYGAMRCSGHKKSGFVPKSVKPKVVIYSELEAWRVVGIMTNKEKQNGTFNAKVPLGPVKCDAGFPHWHLGHSPQNIGRKPSWVIKTQLIVEKIDKWFKDHKRK